MEKKEKMYLFVLAFICIIFLISALRCMQAIQKDVQLTTVLLLAGFVLGIIFVCLQFSHYIRHMDYEKDLLAEKEQLQKECEKEIQSEQEALNQLESNIDQYMKHMEELLKNAEIEKTKEYTKGILESCSQNRWVKMCNHPLLDAVFHSKIELCEKNNIQFYVNSYVPERIPILEKELISIFHNLLNNAIEACLRMEAGTDRWVLFQSGVKNGKFVIKVENSNNKNEKIIGKTWKSDRKLHGLGKKIVKDIAVKYEGNFFCEKEKEKYRAIFIADCEV